MNDNDQNEENECTRDGVRYVFQEMPTWSCAGCVSAHPAPADLCESLPPCYAIGRADRRSGIWTRKEPQP